MSNYVIPINKTANNTYNDIHIKQCAFLMRHAASKRAVCVGWWPVGTCRPAGKTRWLLLYDVYEVFTIAMRR